MGFVSSHTEQDGSKEGVVDYRGHPVDKSRTGGWLGAGLILGSELAERICVMGISMNLVTYLTGDMHLSAAKSANIVTNFMGTLNLLALLGGFLADAKLGRYMTVAVFASVAALGVTLLTMATSLPGMTPPACDYRAQGSRCIEAKSSQLGLLYAALYTIALGGGGIKANVSGFGSDQFDSSDPKEEKAMIFFFNRFYLCVSIGSLFAVTVLVYIQDNVGRGYGYGISAGAMVIAVMVLFCGTKYYRYKKPQGSPLSAIWRVLFLAWRKRALPYPPHPTMLYGFHNGTVPHTHNFKCLDKAAIMEECAARDEDDADSRNEVSTVSQVEEVKMVVKLIPIWSTCILFWTVYSQMTTFTIEQATYMERRVGSFLVPPGSLSVFLILSILLFTSSNERVVVPLARRLTRTPHGITSLQRVGVGLVFAVLAMVASALVEKRRRDHAISSAFWLVPQFFLVGAGEAFAYVGQLEFFIREAPERMKSMSTGFFLTTLSMGFFFSSLLVSIVDALSRNTWLKSNLNSAKLDYFYWLLALLGVLNFLLFLTFASRHQYKAQQILVDVVVDHHHHQQQLAEELDKWNHV